MADPPPYTGDDTNEGPERGETTGTPRWVKVFGIIALVLVLLFVIIHLTGGGLRGHTHGGHTPPSSVTGQGVQQP